MTKNDNKNMAIVGSRGIPSKYSGFEKFTECLSIELKRRDIQVWVSCENGKQNSPEDYFGVKLFYFPFKPPSSSIARYLYEFIYDAYSLLYASLKVDVVYMLGYSAAFFFFIPKIFGKKLWVNPDGIEWRRSKFNPTIKFLLKLCEKLTIFWADDVIADSKEIKKYLDSSYGINSIYIPYGAIPSSKHIDWDDEKLIGNTMEINPNIGYWLMVARLEPENNVHTIIKAYTNSNVDKPLLVIGNFTLPKYEESIRDIINENPNKQVILAGGIYDQEVLNILRDNCFAYIHGHSVGGTNPSLLEIMAMKTVIIAHDNEFNREVCEESALYFDNASNLKDIIENVNENIEDYIILKQKAYQRIVNMYSWETIYYKYEKLLKENYNRP